MKADLIVAAALGGAAYLIYRAWKAQGGGAARTFYAGQAGRWTALDQDDRDMGNAMTAMRETIAGNLRPPAGATYDPLQGAWTLNGMLYT